MTQHKTNNLLPLIITLTWITIFTFGIFAGWMYYDNIQNTRQNDSQEGIWKPLPVEDLPDSGAIDGESPLEAAASMAPYGTDLIQIFRSVGEANDYWKGYRPTYSLGFITTGGGEATSMGSGYNNIEFNFFGNPIILDSTRYEVGATVHGGILVGITRQAIIDSITEVKPQTDGTIEYLVNLPPECVLLLALPVSNTEDDSITPDVNLDQIQIPNSWLSFGLRLDQRYNPTELAQVAMNQGTYQVFTTLNREDLVHQSHVLSVESPTPFNSSDQTIAGQHAHPIIDDIVKEAICWKIAQNNMACDPNLISGTINAAPAPDRLRRCGTGQIIIDEPYATKHVPLN